MIGGHVNSLAYNFPVLAQSPDSYHVRLNIYTLVEEKLRAEGRSFFGNCDLILYTNDATGHDIVPWFSNTNLVRRCKAKLGDNGHFLLNGQSPKSGMNKSLQLDFYR